MPPLSRRSQVAGQRKSGSGGCRWAGGCILEAIASVWVSAYHAAMSRSGALDDCDSAEVRISLIQHDLSTCASKLSTRESELESKIRALTLDAANRKRMGDLTGAKRKIVDRRRTQAQLDKIISSISVIDMHMNTIEGTELNRSILDTLRASGDALKRLGASGIGIEEVEKIVSDVEHQVDAASEITRVIHSANVSGSINSMGYDVATDEELEAELDALLISPQEGDVDGYLDLINNAPKVPSGLSQLKSIGGGSGTELRSRTNTSPAGAVIMTDSKNDDDDDDDNHMAAAEFADKAVSVIGGGSGTYARMLNVAASAH